MYNAIPNASSVQDSVLTTSGPNLAAWTTETEMLASNDPTRHFIDTPITCSIPLHNPCCCKTCALPFCARLCSGGMS
eukprot:4330564-Amphidinium_carterae.1